MLEWNHLQDVDCLTHPPSVVVCSRTGQLEGESLLPSNAFSKDERSQLQVLLVVTPGEIFCILESAVDEEEQFFYLCLVDCRDAG